MADYYTQTSTMLHGVTNEELAWLNERVDPARLTDEEYMKYTEGLNDLEEKEEWPPFRCIQQEDINSVAIADDAGSVDIESLCNFLSAFLRRWRPEDSIELEWANTCSKPRVDAFNGGAAFITHNKVEFHTTNQWLVRQVQEFEYKQLQAERNSNAE